MRGSEPRPKINVGKGTKALIVLSLHFDLTQQRANDNNNSTPRGIEDVSGYPYLFAELMGHGWNAEELTKLAGGNLLRVFSEVSPKRSFALLSLSLGRVESDRSAVFAPLCVRPYVLRPFHATDFL